MAYKRITLGYTDTSSKAKSIHLHCLIMEVRNAYFSVPKHIWELWISRDTVALGFHSFYLLKVYIYYHTANYISYV